MSKTLLRFDKVEGNSIYFINPLSPKDKLRIGSKVASKTLTDGNKVDSVNAQLVQTRVRNVTTCADKCPTGRETQGIRVEFNGALLNSPFLIEDWTQMKETVDSAIASGILKGLKPAMDEKYYMFDKEVVSE